MHVEQCRNKGEESEMPHNMFLHLLLSFYIGYFAGRDQDVLPKFFRVEVQI